MKIKISRDNLIWVDLEMSGLNPEVNTVLEFSGIVTDKNLDPISAPLTFAIYQPDIVLKNMDCWNTEVHTASGLVERCKNSDRTLLEVDEKVTKFFAEYCEEKKSPLCGNSIATDKSFIKKYFPNFCNFLNYRIIDVSSIKELVRRWNTESLYEKKEAHTAELDIMESISELKHYRKNVFKI